MSCRHRNLEMIFTQRFERTVDRDNTVSFYNLIMQLERAEWRPTLAGCKVIIHQHLDRTVSIRFGPHVVGRYDSAGQPLPSQAKAKRGGKGGSMEAGENQRQVFTGSHTPLEISQKALDSHFPTAPTTAAALFKAKAKTKATKAAA